MNWFSCKKINLGFFCCSLLFTNITSAEDKQFDVLLNKELFQSLDKVRGNATVSFEGSVVRQKDGSLLISIDGVDNISISRSFIGGVSSKGDIQYVTFEAMGENIQENAIIPNENKVSAPATICEESQTAN